MAVSTDMNGVVKSLCVTIPSETNFIFVMGKTGQGKSVVSQLIAKELPKFKVIDSCSLELTSNFKCVEDFLIQLEMAKHFGMYYIFDNVCIDSLKMLGNTDLHAATLDCIQGVCDTIFANKIIIEVVIPSITKGKPYFNQEEETDVTNYKFYNEY